MYAGTQAQFEAEYGAQSRLGSRLKVSEIMEGIPDKFFFKAKKTAHNEVTRWYDSGLIIVRYRLTDILALLADGRTLINNGGHPTVSTRRHMNVALGAYVNNGGTESRHVRIHQHKGDQYVNDTMFDQYALVWPSGDVDSDMAPAKFDLHTTIAYLPLYDQG